MTTYIKSVTESLDIEAIIKEVTVLKRIEKDRAHRIVKNERVDSDDSEEASVKLHYLKMKAPLAWKIANHRIEMKNKYC